MRRQMIDDAAAAAAFFRWLGSNCSKRDLDALLSLRVVTGCVMWQGSDSGQWRRLFGNPKAEADPEPVEEDVV